MKLKEKPIQISIVEFTLRCCPLILLSASQNGMWAGRGKNVGNYINQQKRSGMLVGELDLLLTWPDRGILFVEVKSETGKLSEPQENVIDRRTAQGFDCEVVHSLDEYMAALKKHRAPSLHPFVRSVE